MTNRSIHLLTLLALGMLVEAIPKEERQLDDLIAVPVEGTCGIDDEFGAFQILKENVFPLGGEFLEEYQEVSADDVHIFFATNETVPLNSTTSMDCVRQTASLGFEACMYNGSYYALKLNHKFLECQNGSTALYVRRDFLNSQATIVPYAEAPHKITNNNETFLGPVRLSMLSSLVPEISTSSYYKEYTKTDSSSLRFSFVVALGSGTLIEGIIYALDFDNCLNDGAYGLPIYSPMELYAGYSTDIPRFFLSECSETITVTKMGLLIFSHPGFGCEYFPSQSDECTVIFKAQDHQPRMMFALFRDSSSNEACSEFNMTVYASSDPSAEPEITNYCDAGEYWFGPSNTYRATLYNTPTAPWIGFFFRFAESSK